ncbi:MAG: phosphoribosylaminoimidazolesuccinocarboxamide synthase [Phycisphaera sp.]|nr:MAG: phosphoribosylaminoimidazolesuccinocarboxamide synthase [Phycisphaera sp.]
MGSLFQSDLALPGTRGKVRDVYQLGPDQAGVDRLLMVASDRLSAFDVILPTPVPGKGKLLTAVAAFWLQWIEKQGICKTHVISTDQADLPDSALKPAGTTRDQLEGRVTIGRRCEVLPVECVVRGYIEGSGWKDYQETGSICGHPLPSGLQRCAKLPEPIFTPATKAEQGEHDENISEEQAAQIIGKERFEQVRRLSLDIYTKASEYARQRGIIIADTKFEFGIDPADPSGEPILIDEALTPDSSRFWPADEYEPGRTQPSFDKQYVREYLESLVEQGKWDKTAPGPELPADVIRGTLDRYESVVALLTSPTP